MATECDSACGGFPELYAAAGAAAPKKEELAVADGGISAKKEALPKGAGGASAMVPDVAGAVAVGGQESGFISRRLMSNMRVE